MKATYYQRGETLDYFPTENVENGAVVSLGTRIGVAAAPISAGEQGAVHVVGVFAMASNTGSLTVKRRPGFSPLNWGCQSREPNGKPDPH